MREGKSEINVKGLQGRQQVPPILQYCRVSQRLAQANPVRRVQATTAAIPMTHHSSGGIPISSSLRCLHPVQTLRLFGVFARAVSCCALLFPLYVITHVLLISCCIANEFMLDTDRLRWKAVSLQVSGPRLPWTVATCPFVGP